MRWLLWAGLVTTFGLLLFAAALERFVRQYGQAGGPPEEREITTYQESTMTDKTTEAAPIQPVSVTVIGHGDAVGGPAPLVTGMTATTPASHQPNLLVTVISPLAAIAIRFGNTFLTTLLGLVTAGMATNIIPADDFAHLVLACAQLSVAGAGLGAIKDIVTIFSKLEGKFPLLTGNV